MQTIIAPEAYPARNQIVHSELEDELRVLIEPLSQIGIHFFEFDKTFNEPTCIRMSTHAKWISTYLENHFDRIGAFEAAPCVYTSGHITWSELRQEPVYTTARQLFNIDGGITLINKQKYSCEFYHFATDRPNHQLPQATIQNIHQLHQFILVFREKYAHQLKIDTKPAHTRTEKNIFDNQIKRYHLNKQGKDYYLTKREVEILNLLALGKTAEEIGLLLSISRRTCEGHMTMLRTKFNCKSIIEVGFIASSLITSY